MGYSKKVMELFQHPRNIGEMKNPDGIGKIGNPLCGDVMWLFIRVGKDKGGQEIIKSIRVKTFGCVAAIATSSAITDLAKGKTLEEAERISNKNIVDVVEGLPPQKIHCSVLAAQALKRAIDDYKKKKGDWNNDRVR
jgi:nitrogen fixation NifU-like protein